MPDLNMVLARRAMKAAGWASPRPVEVVVSEHGVMTYRARDGVLWVDVAPPGPDVEWLPDLGDGPTLGRMLTLVRERWRTPGIGAHFSPLRRLWAFADVYLPGALRGLAAPTEGGLLVAALEWNALRHWAPDLDSATLGCLTKAVRIRWPDAVVFLDRRGGQDRWRVTSSREGRVVGDGETEGEALVAALEAAHV